MKTKWQVLIGVLTAAIAVSLVVREQHDTQYKPAGGDTFSIDGSARMARPHDVGRPTKSNRTPAPLKELPPLLKNLELVSLTKKPALLVYTSDTVLGKPDSNSLFKFRSQFVRDNRVLNVNSEFVPVEHNIFSAGPFQDRFFLKSIERHVGENPRSGGEETNTFAIIEDRSPGKKGNTHTIKKGSRNGRIIRDYTATLRLNLPGKPANEMKVVDGQSFSLPFGQAAQSSYKFAEVDAEGQVVIEYEGNSRRVGRFYLTSSSTE